MKKVNNYLALIVMTILGSLMSVQTFAQDKGIDLNVNVNKGNDLWYRQPWVWVVGAAVFILLVVAMLKNNKAS